VETGFVGVASGIMDQFASDRRHTECARALELLGSKKPELDSLAAASPFVRMLNDTCGLEDLA